MIPVFVVNLEREVEKRKYIKDLCSSHGLHITSINGVYGQSLDEAHVDRICDQKKALTILRRPLSRGEIGCAVSHMLIYREMIENGIELALVLEDDIVFDESLLRVLHYIHRFPKKWEVILLGHHGPYSRSIESITSLWFTHRLFEKFVLRRFAETSYGTYGYLINKRGAEKLLKSLNPLIKPIDHYTGSEDVVNLYGVFPPCIFPAAEFEEMSNITCERRRLVKEFHKKTICAKIFKQLSPLQESIRHAWLSFKVPKRY